MKSLLTGAPSSVRVVPREAARHDRRPQQLPGAVVHDAQPARLARVAGDEGHSGSRDDLARHRQPAHRYRRVRPRLEQPARLGRAVVRRLRRCCSCTASTRRRSSTSTTSTRASARIARRPRALLAPTQLTLDVRLDVGPERERQDLFLRLRPGRGGKGNKLSARSDQDAVRAHLSESVRADAPPAGLARARATRSPTASRFSTRRTAKIIDSIWTPVAKYLASLAGQVRPRRGVRSRAHGREQVARPDGDLRSGGQAAADARAGSEAAAVHRAVPRQPGDSAGAAGPRGRRKRRVLRRVSVLISNENGAVPGRRRFHLPELTEHGLVGRPLRVRAPVGCIGCALDDGDGPQTTVHTPGVERQSSDRPRHRALSRLRCGLWSEVSPRLRAHSRTNHVTTDLRVAAIPPPSSSSLFRELRSRQQRDGRQRRLRRVQTRAGNPCRCTSSTRPSADATADPSPRRSARRARSRAD